MKDPFERDAAIIAEESHIVKVFGGDPAGEGTGTKQLPKDLFEKDPIASDIIPPLYDPMVWGFLLEQNTRLKKLVQSMADNTVGLGWEIVPRKEEEELQEQEREAFKAEKEKLAALIEDINPDDPFNEVCKRVKTDEEATGQGYFEAIRSNAGAVVQLFHVASHTLRLAKSTKGRIRYVQMRAHDPSKKVWFKAFNETNELDAETGKWEDEGVEISADNRATEIVQFNLYSPRSSYYGVPRVVSAAPAVAGNRLAHRRNVAFFENDATPRMAIIVNGGELSGESMKMIEEFVDARAKGPGNAGRLMVLQARGADDTMGDAKQIGIQLVPLTVGVQDDASFTRYTTMNNEEVREAFGIGQIFIGTSSDVNRAVALAMKQLTVEQVFEPEAKRYEYRLNKVILGTNGAKMSKLRFVRPRTDDIIAESQAISLLAAAGGVTPNDIRDFRRKARFNGKWADTPISLTKLGLLEDSADETATMFSVYKDKLPPPPPAKGGAPAPHLDGDYMKAMYGDHSNEVRDFIEDVHAKLTAMGFDVSIAPPAELVGRDKT